MPTTQIPAVQIRQDLPGGSPTPQLVTIEMTEESRSVVKRRKPPGWIPPTNYDLSVVNRRGSEGVYSIMNKLLGSGTKYTGAVAGALNSVWTVEFVTNTSALSIQTVNDNLLSLSNTALITARNNLKQMKVDLGTAFGERNQTARLIGDTASQLARAVRNLRRGRVRDAMRDLGLSRKHGEPRGSNWPQKWLELQYGWKPLLSDIYGACDALSKRDTDDFGITAKGNAKTFLTNQFSNSNPGTSWYVSASEYELGAYVRVDAFLGPLNKLSSLGVTNPLMVAWELVPYSFVVDWFLPIGAWISSIDATLGVTIRGVSSTTFKRAKHSGHGVSHDEGNLSFTNSWVVSKTDLRVIRTASTVLPFASFPSLKDPRSLGHMANGLSLLAQAFR